MKYNAEEIKFDVNGNAHIPHGLYKIYWKTGGHSLASMGFLKNGCTWIACANWINEEKARLHDHIETIDSLELIERVNYEEYYEKYYANDKP